MIGIGIDTGGTCTDAVILDTKDHSVLSYGKTLTTKRDLKEGILKALRALDQDLLRQADYLSLSTTLATNACVEGKGGRARLVCIGVKPAVIESMQGVYGLPPVSEIYFLAGDAAREATPDNRPDWETFRRDLRDHFGDCDSVAVVQINPKYNDGAYEKEAEALIRSELGVPCVRGYDLYQEINVQRRGATALLNARLLPVMAQFFDSIDRALAELGLHLPIWVVKSDGSIMSRDYALERPVETLLCGPAASIIGAMELSAEPDALIVDMGGTTSDVALVRQRVPVTSQAGITIGPWKTMVKGVTMDTFALGGDSAVEYADGQIFLGEHRVVPLCMAASQYPQVLQKLRDLTASYAVYSYPACQFFLLAQRPEQPERFTEHERALIEALADGPLIFADAAARVGVSPYLFKTRRLEEEGVILRCGVTPTDVMHVCGDYTDYDVEAARLGITYLRYATRKPYDQVCREIYDLAKERLFNHLARILLEYETGEKLDADNAAAMERLTSWMFRRQSRGHGYQYVMPQFRTTPALVGIGAPTHIFLRDVAALLHAKVDVPVHAKVANAVGAAVGSVVSRHTVRIERAPAKTGEEAYMVSGGEKPEFFETYAEALDRAEALAAARAEEKARQQGAAGPLRTQVEVQEDSYDLGGDNRLFLQTQVVGSAEAQA